MRASWKHDGALLTLTMLPDEEDDLVSQKSPPLRMLTNTAHVRFPTPIELPHPDLLALAAYAVAWPWTRRRLRMDRPVSEPMAEALASDGIEAEALEGRGRADPRVPGKRVSLAYSSGADSIAASELLPDDTAYVHLRRVRHPRVVNRMTHVRVDVIEQLARRAADLDRDLSVVETDLEYTCLPFATYPVWWAIAIASILSADSMDAGAIALGTVLESRYTRNGTKFSPTDPRTSVHRLFDAAGAPILRPVAGMTEVGTARVSMASDLSHLSRSCLLGSLRQPCLNCDKCLRKELTMAAIRGRELPAEIVRAMMDNPSILKKMQSPPPLYFQCMLEYSLARVDVRGTPLEQVRDLLAPTIESTTWAEGYYPPALLDEVPERFRPGVADRLSKHMRMMTPEEVTVVETWDAAERVAGGRALG